MLCTCTFNHGQITSQGQEEILQVVKSTAHYTLPSILYPLHSTLFLIKPGHIG